MIRPAHVVAALLLMMPLSAQGVRAPRVVKAPIKRYAVAIGTKAHQTPQGLFKIQHIVWNPGWHPPDAAWAADKKPAKPGDPENPMKVVKLFFQEPDYYIHGTDKDESLGGAASHGCLRMSESDVTSLARLRESRPTRSATCTGAASQERFDK